MSPFQNIIFNENNLEPKCFHVFRAKNDQMRPISDEEFLEFQHRFALKMRNNYHRRNKNAIFAG